MVPIEFYQDFSNTFKRVLYFRFGSEIWREFTELTPVEIETIFCHLMKFPEAKIALLHLSRHFKTDKTDLLKRFIQCNWTSLDNKFDITAKRLNYEYVHCPYKGHGNCLFDGEGKVCQKIHSRKISRGNLTRRGKHG